MKGRLPHLLAAAVIAIALCESALGLYGPRSVASDADWQAAAGYVREQLRADDLIVFAPAWIDPVGRHHLGDRMPVEMVARADDDRYARIWELSVRGARAEDARDLTPAETRAFGRVTVRRYDKPAVKVVHDLTSAFAGARVSLQPIADPGAPEQPCTVDGKARRCAGSRVEPRVLEIDYRPRRGVLAPLVAGQRIVVTYDEVPGGHLVGYVGLHDYYARKNGDGVATFRLRADGTKSVLLPVRNPRKDGEGWQRFDLDLGPGTHQVRIELEAPNVAHRLIGFHAEVREARP